MEKIGNNEFYELSYDNENNRIIWKMKGFWSSMDVAPDFQKDWDTVQGLSSPGSMILADLTELKAMPADVIQANMERQGMLIQEGCKKVGCAITLISTVMTLKKALKGSGMESIIKLTETVEDAQAFLDEE
jgi:hypothetical protein